MVCYVAKMTTGCEDAHSYAAGDAAAGATAFVEAAMGGCKLVSRVFATYLRSIFVYGIFWPYLLRPRATCVMVFHNVANRKLRDNGRILS